MRMSEEWLRERLRRDSDKVSELPARGKQKKKIKRRASSNGVSKARQAAQQHHQISADGVHTIQVKPMSVNAAWKGQRFKSDEYKTFEQYCSYILPASIEIPDGPLEIYLLWGVSSNQADYDNPIKPFQDILQKQFGFDDRRIYDAHISKREVEPGREFIKFKIVRASMRCIFDLCAGEAG